MRAIRRADLAQFGAAGRDDVGQAERAADLDLLPPRNHHFPSPRQGVEQQEHGGRVVVDYSGCFRGGRRAYKGLDVPAALAALARLQLEFEVAIAGGHSGDGLLGRLGEGRTAQAGVQHHAGGIDDAMQPGRGFPLNAAAHGPLDPQAQGRPLLGHSAFPHLATHVRNAAAHLRDDIGAVVFSQQVGDLFEDLIYRRQPSFIHGGEV